jgi:hypothetical protein
MMIKLTYSFVLLLVFVLPRSGYSYVGPGTGLTGLGSLFALLAAVFVAIAGFVWFPVKRLLNKWKKARHPDRTKM